MFVEPMDIRKVHPVRKTKQQKWSFCKDVQFFGESLGYSVQLEEGKMGARNIIFGDPEKAKYLITAHYDTPARLLMANYLLPTNLPVTLLLALPMIAFYWMGGFLVGGCLGKGHWLAGIAGLTVLAGLLLLKRIGPANPNNANDNTSGVVTLLEIARTMPVTLREKVCFVLFDLEEAGMVGSASYRKAHKAATEQQIVLNLDCVGDGDEIVFFPTDKLRKDPKKLACLYRVIGRYGDKTIDVREKGYASFPSDQRNFPFGVGIAAFHRHKWAGLYLNRIHTPKDTLLEETNVNLLRASLTSLVSCDAAE